MLLFIWTSFVFQTLAAWIYTFNKFVSYAVSIDRVFRKYVKKEDKNSQSIRLVIKEMVTVIKRLLQCGYWHLCFIVTPLIGQCKSWLQNAKIYPATIVSWVNVKQQLPYCHHEKREYQQNDQGRRLGAVEEELDHPPITHNNNNNKQIIKFPLHHK